MIWDLLSEEARRMVAGLMIAAPMVIFVCLIGMLTHKREDYNG